MTHLAFNMAFAGRFMLGTKGLCFDFIRGLSKRTRRAGMKNTTVKRLATMLLPRDRPISTPIGIVIRSNEPRPAMVVRALEQISTIPFERARAVASFAS